MASIHCDDLIEKSLCGDVLIEMSSWLPAKVICKFKCTNKFFLNFSRDSYFALRQTQKALLKDEPYFFIQPNFSQRFNENIIELHHLSGDNSSGVSKDVLDYLAKSTKILSSANGLILCRDKTSNSEVQLFLINPATQAWMPIPIPEQLQHMGADADLKVILECDDKNNCMVSFFYNNSDDWSLYWDCKVYLTKEGIWKEKEGSLFTGSRSLKFDMPVFYNGDVHFISDCSPYLIKGSFYFRPYIMSYNFENGTTKLLRLPKEARRGSHDISCNMGIFKWGKHTSSTQSICLVRLRKHVFTVWILTKYESSLWKRILKVRVKAMGLMEKDPDVTGFCVMNGDLLVFSTQRKVYGYGLTNGNYMKTEEICEHGCDNKVCFTSYSNTMQICGADNARALLLRSRPFDKQRYTFPFEQHQHTFSLKFEA